ncbi:MAG: membrane protein [Melioribacteraceae bacterium]|nr:MAG: membrane protein [Melioribacteraceae bacterium]
MKFKFILFLFLSVLMFAQEKDSIKVYHLEAVEIVSKKVALSDRMYPMDKDNLGVVLNNNGFNLIRKGVFFAQDIYSDGFKRDDINVVVDGERYHSACPNRMDSPLTRVNPMDMESVELSKSGSLNQCGLAGKVEFRRSAPSDALRVKSSLTYQAAAMSGIDGAVSVEKSNHRISFRYAEGLPYEDAESRKFSDLYGYNDDYKYKLGEVSFLGETGEMKYGLSGAYNENISFPYLMMDEKYNRVSNGFVSYKGHKAYFNYTSHLMDNTLRPGGGLMVTDAKNLTVGVTGHFYDFYYRNWKADNQILAMGNLFENNLIPGVNNAAFSLLHEMNYFGLDLSGKVGVSYFDIAEPTTVSFYDKYVSDANSTAAFVTFGLNAAYTKVLSDKMGYGLIAEVNSEAPQTEALFIAVGKPPAKPDWSGNPGLNQPLKAGLRASFIYDRINFEVFGNYVSNYVSLTKVMTTKAALTYKNINAYFAGVNIGFQSEYIDSELNYTYAQNTTDDRPVAEIQPLQLKNTIKLPEFSGINIFIRHTYNNAQTRVDEFLGETSTSAFNKFDAGVSYSFSDVTFSLEAENITNELYYQHLSYLRNPFASGMRVFEPGTNLRMNVRYGM